MQAILQNTFHNREVAVAIMGELPYTLTRAQAQKVRRVLCGHKDCTCGVVRGPAFDTLKRRVEVYADSDEQGRLTWTIANV